MHLDIRLDELIKLVEPRASDREILNRLDKIIKQGEVMAAELDRLTSEVEETKGVIQSAITFITGILEQLRNAGTDPAKLDALANDLDSHTRQLAQAIASNPGTGTGTGPVVDPNA